MRTQRFLWLEHRFSIVGSALAGLCLILTGCNASTGSSSTSGVVPMNAIRNAGITFRRGGSTGSTVSVDMRQYMAAVINDPFDILPGYMLCQATTGTEAKHCSTSFPDSAGEAQLQGSKGSGVDWIAITKWVHTKTIPGASKQYIGVIRNWTGPASNNYANILRCFSTPNDACGSPSDASIPLEGVPYLIKYLPVVPLKNLKDAENAKGAPTGPIAGSLVTTPSSTSSNYWNFGIVKLGKSSEYSCENGSPYTTGHTKNLIVYVTGVPFGGNIGTQDAIVIDGYSGQNSSRDHMERDFYVLGYGRVRSGISFYVGSGQYGGPPDYNSVYNNYEQYNGSYFNLRSDNCSQGSAISLWPTGTSTFHKP